VIRSFRHRPLHQLNLGLLAGTLKQPAGVIKLLPRSAQLSHEYREIEQARHHEQEGSAEGKQRDKQLRIHQITPAGI
jgi:hypothetical protein